MEHQFKIAPEGSLNTYAQKIKYVRQRIADHQASSLSAKTLKHNPLNEVTTEQPAPVEEKKDAGTDSFQNTMGHFIMYMKGKGKGKFNSWKGIGDKGKGTKRGRWRKRENGEQR